MRGEIAADGSPLGQDVHDGNTESNTGMRDRNGVKIPGCHATVRETKAS
jgi:hypothetical protein